MAMTDDQRTAYDEARSALIAAITKEAKKAGTGAYATRCRDLAEAYAWLTSPAQSHGGTASS